MSSFYTNLLLRFSRALNLSPSLPSEVKVKPEDVRGGYMDRRGGTSIGSPEKLESV